MEEKNPPNITVAVNVDCTGLDEAIAKAHQLVELLQEANRLMPRPDPNPVFPLDDSFGIKLTSHHED